MVEKKKKIGITGTYEEEKIGEKDIESTYDFLRSISFHCGSGKWRSLLKFKGFKWISLYT